MQKREAVGNRNLLLPIDRKNFENKIPDYVWVVSNRLWKNGFEAYLVGGGVRDILMGRDPKDYDIATNAKPEQVQKIFPRSIATGAKFGTVTVLSPTKEGEDVPIEVTTYRCEEDYIDGRWPSKVVFTEDIMRDLGRRNFTINAMAYCLHPKESERQLLDPFDGLGDIKRKLIRAVGTPLERMKEDGLRGFIACRQASVLGFTIEKETFNAIKKTLTVAKMVSIERVRDEFLKLLYDSPKPSVGIEYLRKTGLLKIFIPELLEGINTAQKKFHVENVYLHLLHSCDKAVDEVKVAALFHDIGKPRCRMPDGHFYGHDIVGAKMTKAILTRLKFPKSEVKRITTLVRYHMFWYRDEWTDAAVRRLLRRLGGESIFDQLVALRMADSQANPKANIQPWAISKLQERVARLKQEEMALKVTDLAVRGDDAIKLGVPKNKRLGVLLNYLLDLVVDNPMENSKPRLEKQIKKFVEHNCELLWLVDEKDLPVMKGYIEDAKSKGLCYRWVELVVADSAGKVLIFNGSPILSGFCFPDEGYIKAVKRIGWEVAQVQFSKENTRKVDYLKETDEKGICRFTTLFFVVGKAQKGEWVEWNKIKEKPNTRLLFWFNRIGTLLDRLVNSGR